MSHLDNKRLTIMPSMQTDRNGHWSDLTDLPSQSALLGCATVCDTCYLKRLLIHIRMILMYHKENVTSPIQHNKDKHCTNISTPHIRVIICMLLYEHANTWYVNRVRINLCTQGCISTEFPHWRESGSFFLELSS